MQGYVNVGPCAYTSRNWGWEDANDDGAAGSTTVAWDQDAQATYNVYELFHNGWFIHTNATWGWIADQTLDCWSAIGVRSRGAANYAISVFGDNNRNHHLASDYLSRGVRFVVGDFNHNNLGEDHIRLTNLGGAGQYVLSYEAGSQVLYPDGVDRAQTWSATRRGARPTTCPLFAGETIQRPARRRHGRGSTSAWRSSAPTAAPTTRRAPARVWQEDDWPAGIAEDAHLRRCRPTTSTAWSSGPTPRSTGNFSRQDRPVACRPWPKRRPFTSSLDLRLYSYAPTPITGPCPRRGRARRPTCGCACSRNSTFRTVLATSGAYPGVEFIAADYNPGFSTDYLRVDRQSGVSSVPDRVGTGRRHPRRFRLRDLAGRTTSPRSGTPTCWPDRPTGSRYTRTYSRCSTPGSTS